MSVDDAALREAICAAGRSLHARGYVHATAGNISARLGDGGFLITPTDASLATLDAARLAHVDAAGTQMSGDRASKTLALHRAIYDADPDAACVIHTHSTSLVELSLLGVADPADVLPPITPYFVMKVGHVAQIPYHRPGDPAVLPLVTAHIRRMAGRGTPVRCVLLERLGPVAWHRTPQEAMAVLEELEETATLWLRTRAAPLAEHQIEELRRHSGARW